MRSTSVKLLIGGCVGLLVISGWGLLGLGVLESIFGGQPNLALVLLGLLAILIGPVLLGFTNTTNLPRILLTSLLAPIGATSIYIALFLFIGILEWLTGAVPDNNAAPLFIVAYVAALIGITEVLTDHFSVTQILNAFYGVGTAILIVIGIELLTSFVPAIGLWSVPDAGWEMWLIAGLYAVLVGINTTYFKSVFSHSDTQISRLTHIIFFGSNLAILLIVLILRL